MIPPPRRNVASSEEWRRICSEFSDSERSPLVIVHTPSAASYAEENFSWAPVRHFLAIKEEPCVQDLAPMEQWAFDSRPLVIGIGGGKALDAAKAVAAWGGAEYRSMQALTELLKQGGKVAGPRHGGLLLAPSIASSGSESSRAAILTVGDHKTGLRGDCLLPEAVVHDPRLWATLTPEIALHHAFDIFAHLIETVVSLRRSAQTSEHAETGLAELGKWIFEKAAAPDAYQDAMNASYHAGICLASSSTCMPHRIQYIIGPATRTTHVEGIWYLAPAWIAGVRERCPERLAEFEALLHPGRWGLQSAEQMLSLLHEKAAPHARRERFAPLRTAAQELASKVTGDLAADPSYTGIEDVERLIKGNL